MENETPQGTMSPTLFNTLMNVFAIIPYPVADEIVLQTTGKDSSATLERSLNLLTSGCEQLGFTISQ